MKQPDHEALFIQTVKQLADKYGVEAIFDFNNNTIEFEGECDETALAIELEDIFGEYAI